MSMIGDGRCHPLAPAVLIIVRAAFRYFRPVALAQMEFLRHPLAVRGDIHARRSLDRTHRRTSHRKFRLMDHRIRKFRLRQHRTLDNS
jgi:hypothetical protein